VLALREKGPAEWSIFEGGVDFLPFVKC